MPKKQPKKFLVQVFARGNKQIWSGFLHTSQMNKTLNHFANNRHDFTHLKVVNFTQPEK